MHKYDRGIIFGGVFKSYNKPNGLGGKKQGEVNKIPDIQIRLFHHVSYEWGYFLGIDINRNQHDVNDNYHMIHYFDALYVVYKLSIFINNQLYNAEWVNFYEKIHTVGG